MGQKRQAELGFNRAKLPIMLWRKKRREMRLPADPQSIKREQDDDLPVNRSPVKEQSSLTKFRNRLHK
jgi:hypothetical protein